MDVRIPACLNQLPDPYPLLGAIQAAGPVCPVGGSQVPSWIITRHAEVLAALDDGRLSSDPASDTRPPDDRLAGHVSRTAFAGSMFTSDPPGHTRLRRAVAPYLARRQVASLGPFIEQTASSLIDGLSGDRTDAVDDFAAPLTVQTICRLLGLPSREHRNVLRWSHALMTEQADEAARHRSRDGGQALAGFLASFLAWTKAHPGDGLISALATAPASTRLTDREILTMSMLLLVAGHETGIGLISAAIRHLLCDPQTSRALRDRPASLPRAIDEVLRYDGPVTLTVRRIATADIRYPDATIHAGDHVFVCLASANRDERQFAQPATLIIDRHPNPHLAFGHGIHRCPGAALAVQEARVAMDLLLRRTHTLSLAIPAADLHWRQGKLRCLEHLPVALTTHP